MDQKEKPAHHAWHRNEIFGGRTASEYLTEYARAVQRGLASVDPKALDSAVALLAETRSAGRHVFVAGNGGSASIADHLCCDFTKGDDLKSRTALKSTSLASNGALLTAIANDFGFETAFATQIHRLGDPRDVAILISSSGKSQNILNALQACHEKGLKVIGLTGFEGGLLRAKCDISLHVGVMNYGVVEDCHQSLMHTMAQVLHYKG